MKPFIMRSYLKFTGDEVPVLKYAVARYETGIVMAHDLDCEEAEKYRDQLNKDERQFRLHKAQMRGTDAEFDKGPTTAPTVEPVTMAYPAQPPRLDDDAEVETNADRVESVLSQLATWRKRAVLDTVAMRMEYYLRTSHGKR